MPTVVTINQGFKKDEVSDMPKPISEDAFINGILKKDPEHPDDEDEQTRKKKKPVKERVSLTKVDNSEQEYYNQLYVGNRFGAVKKAGSRFIAGLKGQTKEVGKKAKKGVAYKTGAAARKITPYAMGAATGAATGAAITPLLRKKKKKNPQIQPF